MEFTFETTYDQKAFTAMARALRKTIRQKRSRRAHILGWITAVLGMLLALSATEINIKLMITVTAVVLIVVVLIFEDSLNAYIARRRMLSGMEKSIVTFTEEGYHSETAVGSSDFPYTNIQRIAETREYYVFLFSISHAQIYDKSTLTGGTLEDFRAFITRKTDIQLEII